MCFLKADRELPSLSWAGSEFHTVGAATAKRTCRVQYESVEFAYRVDIAYHDENAELDLSIYSYTAHNSRTEHCRAWSPATAQNPV